MVAAGTKPSAPVSSSLMKKPGLGDAGDLALECGADPVGQEMGDQAVVCLPLRRHGAALGRRDAGADLDQLGAGGVGRQAVLAELQRGDQRAVHDEVGVAADRRGEMRVALQVQAEMAVILGRILGLRLASAARPR